MFVDPTRGVSGPFDYGNEIIKGQMGTGKTMYLRANYLYYLSTLVPQMIEQNDLVLPVYIKLSDYQNLREADDIYNKVIVRIVREILDTCERIQSANELVKLHMGIHKNLYGIWIDSVPRSSILEKLSKMSSEEYVERVTTEIKGKGTLGNNFLQACGEYGKTNYMELKNKPQPQVEDIVQAYEALLRPVNAKLLILFDEVGSINKCFFEESGGTSRFEILMNQLRTLDFVRTKIAIYPHTFADVLTETRYGDVITLEDSIYNEEGYENFLSKTLSIAEKYLSACAGEDIVAEDIFDVSSDNVQILEQIIYASDGNMRRLVQLLDAVLDSCYRRCSAKEKANITDAYDAIRKQAYQMQALYSGSDLEFLQNLTTVCKKRTAYRFRCPNKSPILLKYTNKSSEYNIIKIKENGTGRRGTVYWFDYAYCLYADIPTHYQFGSERIARSRSRSEGNWITTITNITDELIIQAGIPNKIEGTIAYLNSERTAGFISDGTRDDIFFTKDQVLETDRKKELCIGKRLYCVPVEMNGGLTAFEIEVP